MADAALLVLLLGRPSHTSPSGSRAADGALVNEEGESGLPEAALLAMPTVLSRARPQWRPPVTWKSLRRPRGAGRPTPANDSYLVDSASSHMLVSKIKPCMSKYKQLYGETANGSLYKLSFI